MLGSRVLTAVIGVPLVLAATWAGGWALALLLAAISLINAWEWQRLSRQAGPGSDGWILYGGSLWLVLAGPALAPFETAGLTAGLLFLASAIRVLFLFKDPARGEEVLARAGTALAGAVYAGWLLAHLGALRGWGWGWALFALLVTWGNDTLAYFAGRAVGGPRLAPRLSPGKTWSGAAGGLLGGALAGGLLAAWGGVDLTLPAAAGYGLVGALLAQAGDLFESLLKRTAGVKDSGRLLPGHGGLLDRFDSLIFVAPGLYYLRALLLLLPGTG